MKWGVKKSEYKSMSRQQKKQTKKTYKDQKKFEKNVSKNWTNSYNKAAHLMNSKIESINKKHKGADLSKGDTKANRAYVKDMGKAWTNTYSKVLLKDFGTEPISKGKDWVKKAPFMDMYDSKHYF